MYNSKLENRIKWICLAFVVVFLCYLGITSVSAIDKRVEPIYKATAKLLVDDYDEWSVIALSSGDFEVDEDYYSTYYNKLVDRLNEKNGILSKTKYTEYSRVILALTSIGKDVRNVGGYNLLEKLSDFNKVKLQGINGPIWALIALDSGNYSLEENPNIRETLIDYILEKEIKTGGWALGGDNADPEITAMAVTSLAKYCSDTRVNSAVNRAVKVLSEKQNQYGSYTVNGIESSECVAQTITCLSTLGINPNTDKRFVKNSKSLVDSLLDFSVEGGGFAHIKGGSLNMISTQQALYSLVAYDKLCQKDEPIFDMTEEVTKAESPTSHKVMSESDNSKKDNVATKPTNSREVASTAIGEKTEQIGSKADSESNSRIEPKGESKVESNNKSNTESKSVSKGYSQGDKNSALANFKTKTTNAENTEVQNNTVTTQNAVEEKKEALVREQNSANEEESSAGNNISLIVALSIVAVMVILIVILILRKKSKKDILVVFVVGIVAIILVMQTEFQSVEEYYTTHIEDVKKDSKTVTMTIECSTILDNMDKLDSNLVKYVPKDGIILEETEFVLNNNDTVFDILDRVTRYKKIQMEYQGAEKNSYGTAYVEGINYLYEYSCGELSGWTFSVNNKSFQEGSSLYKLKDGDKIVWSYTCDLGRDVGCEVPGGNDE